MDLQIELPRDAGSSDALVACFATALALRCFTGNVYVRGLSSDILAPAGIQAREVVQRNADLAGHAHRLHWDGGSAAVRLVVGADGNPGDVAVAAAGWTAFVNQMPGRPSEAVAPAAAFAAASGIAKLFARHVLGNGKFANEAYCYSLLEQSMSDGTQTLMVPALGRTALLGAGAIGTAVALVLDLSGWTGELLVVDRDYYDEPNIETSILISRSAATAQNEKATSLVSLLDRQGFRAEGLRQDIVSGSDFIRDRRDCLIVAVDNPETRRLFDDCGASLVINAGVGDSRVDAGHVLVSRHGPEDPGLSALYPNRYAESTGTASFPEEYLLDECSRVAYGSASLAAPFVALAAGALAVTEVVRHAMQLSSPINYQKFDLLQRQGKPELSRRRSIVAADVGSVS